MLGNIRNFLNAANLSALSLPVIKFTDIIDILIVAYFIYKVVLWIKQTRAWSLLKGLVIFLVISVLAFIFKLYTIAWFVSSAFNFNVGIIAIIILFQPELRKALEQIGKGKLQIPFLGDVGSVSILSEENLKHIVTAAQAMAKVRTGALIVMENQVALGDLEQTGIRIDGIITSQLLINIFENKTPLHDGAVIIRNNKIAAACCILPLTQAEIDKAYGTRHRAAIGASEVSDCFVLVVSEETGKISIARGGKLYKDLTEQKIYETLAEVVADTHKQKEKGWLVFFRGLKKE